LWKREDFPGAMRCFEEGLRQGRNEEGLRLLSMVKRQAPARDMGARFQMIQESLSLAKEAVRLDPQSHKAWYNLGNTHCFYFFSTSHDTQDLKRALACYRQSESLNGDDNPDLYLNRGNVLCYLCRYGEAVDAYERSVQIDPLLRTAENARDEISRFLERVYENVSRRGKLRKRERELFGRQLLGFLFWNCHFIVVRVLGPFSQPPDVFLVVWWTDRESEEEDEEEGGGLEPFVLIVYHLTEEGRAHMVRDRQVHRFQLSEQETNEHTEEEEAEKTEEGKGEGVLWGAESALTLPFPPPSSSSSSSQEFSVPSLVVSHPSQALSFASTRSKSSSPLVFQPLPPTCSQPPQVRIQAFDK
jgi:hypothetical protein